MGALDYVSVEVVTDRHGVVYFVEMTLNGFLRITREDGHVLNFDVGEQGIYLRSAIYEGRILSGYVSHSRDRLVLVSDTGRIVDLCPCSGPPAIDANPDGTFHVVVFTPASMLMWHVTADGDPIEQVPTSFDRSSSQGFLDMDDAVPLITDDARSATVPVLIGDAGRVRNVELTLWMARGPYMSGQVDKRFLDNIEDVVGLYDVRTKRLRLASVETQLPPRLAVGDNGLPIVAVTANPSRFLHLQHFDREYSYSEDGPTPPPVVVPPKPPKPEDPRMTMDQMQDLVLSHPNTNILGKGDTEDARRKNSLLFINQVVLDIARTGHRAGLHTKSGGSLAFLGDQSYSTDIIIVDDDGIDRAVDIVKSSEDPSAAVAWQPGGAAIPGAFRPGRPEFALSSAVPGNPPGDPGPGPSLPGTDSAKLDEILSILRRTFR